MPQGSHCGPFLYSLYCSDLPTHIKHSRISLYADDTKLFRKINNDADRRLLQADINALVKWSKQHRLQLNAKKTFHVTYGTDNRRTVYFVHEQRIEQVSCIRDLGVMFDNGLTFKRHTENIYNRLNQMVGAASRLTREVGHPPLILKIYRIYMMPIIEYCCVIWMTDRVTEIKSIERIQRRVTSIAFSNPRRRMPGHLEYDQRLNRLNMMTLSHRLHTQFRHSRSHFQK